MGYPSRVQRIDRRASQQWYVNFPAALARAMNLKKGEVIEWTIQDANALVLRRTATAPTVAAPAERKKKR